MGLLAAFVLALAAALPHPKVATQAMMLAIASGELPLASFVDPAAGVVLDDDSPDPSFDVEHARARPALLCGAALDRFVARWQRGLARARDGLRHDHDEGRLECHNRPGPPTCTFGREMEWDPAVHFIFRVDATRGLVLAAVTLDDELQVARAEVAAEHRRQARLIARLAAPGCRRPRLDAGFCPMW